MKQRDPWLLRCLAALGRSRYYSKAWNSPKLVGIAGRDAESVREGGGGDPEVVGADELPPTH